MMKMSSFFKNPRHVLGLLVLAALLVSLGWLMYYYQQSKSQAVLTVGATYYPLYDMAKAVGGDLVTVTNITPAGAEPHDYEPTPQQLVDLGQDDVLFYNGATFEPWIPNFLHDYKGKAVPASQHIALIPLNDQTEGSDPHFWLDPQLAQTMVLTIRDTYIELDPAHSSNYTSQAEEYLNKLRSLDSQYTTGLASCSLRTVISSHDALTYLAKHYQFNVEAIAGFTPEDEPSAAKLAELTALAKAQKIKVVLFETLVNPKMAETLATEVGAQAMVFDPLEGLSDDDLKAGKNYLSVQQDNLETLRKAMQCQ